MKVLIPFCFLWFVADVEKPRTWEVDGVKREAIIFAPSQKTEKAPVVFAFHGHGGTMKNSVKKFRFQEIWPEAVVVYMQGLPTATKNDPKGERPGWQPGPGVEKDRDLKFFDAVLATIKKEYSIDEKRIYATGHSNGGGFTYLLWGTRGDHFAAFAPSAAAGARYLKDAKPKPMLHIAGENDPTVPFENQKKSIEAVKKANGCEESGQQWAKDCQLYPSKKDCPVVIFLHKGNHKYPDEAPERTVQFFKEHAKK